MTRPGRRVRAGGAAVLALLAVAAVARGDEKELPALVPVRVIRASRTDVELLGHTAACEGIRVDRAFQLAHAPVKHSENGAANGVRLRVAHLLGGEDPTGFDVGGIAELGLAMAGDRIDGFIPFPVGRPASVPAPACGFALPGPCYDSEVRFDAVHWTALAGASLRWTNPRSRKISFEIDGAAGLLLAVARYGIERTTYACSAAGTCTPVLTEQWHGRDIDPIPVLRIGFEIGLQLSPRPAGESGAPRRPGYVGLRLRLEYLYAVKRPAMQLRGNAGVLGYDPSGGGFALGLALAV